MCRLGRRVTVASEGFVRAWCGRGAGQVPSGSGAVRRQHNQRLKLTARVDYGMNCSSARRSLSAIR